MKSAAEWQVSPSPQAARRKLEEILIFDLTGHQPSWPGNAQGMCSRFFIVAGQGIAE
jgi:hypothetical protein